jgi:hypothetical protein
MAERNRRFVAQMRRAAEAESPRARGAYWRERTDEERGQALYNLLAFTAAVARARGEGWEKPPLPPTRLRRR